jgi:hypothetical protein
MQRSKQSRVGRLDRTAEGLPAMGGRGGTELGFQEGGLGRVPMMRSYLSTALNEIRKGALKPLGGSTAVRGSQKAKTSQGALRYSQVGLAQLLQPCGQR